MRVGVVGTGHVGLPTAAVLARCGHEVWATDSDREKLEILRAGGEAFFEPRLADVVRESVEARRLFFTPEIADVLSEASAVFLCVGTPPKASGEANLALIERATVQIARHASGPLLVVEKSTVPAGSAERIRQTLSRRRPDIRFDVVSNPEFLRAGTAVQDSLNPDRILVGGDSAQALATMRDLYRPLIESGVRWIETDVRTAELAKHACNAFLALKVSFANALARLSEATDADVTLVAEVMGADPRIGPAHLSAGLGYGGYCFPKDLQAFDWLAGNLGYEFPLLREVARINEEAVDAVFQKVKEALWNVEGKRVALLGLSFKPGTDDVRFSPALTLARMLLEAGAEVVGYDPQAGANAKAEVPGLEVVGDAYTALDGAHCAVMATEWPELVTLDLARARELMEFPVIVDGRNVFDPEIMRAEGFTYLPAGRPAVRP